MEIGGEIECKIPFLGSLKLFISRDLDKNKPEKSEIKQKALEALYNALTETNLYLRDLKLGNMNQDRQDELARSWKNASVKLIPVNQELSERCSLKGQYWMEPDTWTEQEIINAGIEITEITESIESIKCS